MYAIRTGLHADVPRIHEIMVIAHDTLKDKAWYFIDGTTPQWLHRHIEDEGFALVVEDDMSSTIVGFLVVRYPYSASDNLGTYLNDSALNMNTVAHMETVAVLPKHRGHGLQCELVTRAESRLHKNIEHIMCTVHKDNGPSYNSFVRCGYKTIANLYAKYGNLPRYVMHKPREL